jgi:hypothetical protein
MNQKVLIIVQWAVIAFLAAVILFRGDDNKNPVPAPVTSTAAPKPVEKKTLPSFTSQGLAYAKEQAKESGFENTTSHDATSRQRKQVFDKEWKVCFQSPGAGVVIATTVPDFAVVKINEQCPTKDEGRARTRVAAETMPNLLGSSVKAAQQQLPNASIDYVDVSGKERAMLISKNWRVCQSEPKAGQRYGGVPVKLYIAKYGESC